MSELDPAPEVTPSGWRRFLAPSRAQRRRMLGRELLVLGIVSWVVFVLARVVPQDLEGLGSIHEVAAWLATLVHALGFHLGLVVAAMGLLALAIRAWWPMLLLGSLALVTLAPAAWSWIDPPEPARGPAQLRVMSMNVLVHNTRYDDVAAAVLEAQPDVLLVQEYSQRWHNELRSRIGKEYPHVRFETSEDSFGAATYSRRPFVGEEQRIELGGDGTPQTRSFIRVDGRRVAIYNIHLLPPISLDYATRQRGQVARLLRVLKDERHAAIVGGDFNLTPDTYQQERLERLGFQDAWDEAGRGRGATWPRNGVLRMVPGIRLDHLYLSPQLGAAKVRRGDANGSDHRPLVVDLRVE